MTRPKQPTRRKDRHALPAKAYLTTLYAVVCTETGDGRIDSLVVGRRETDRIAMAFIKSLSPRTFKSALNIAPEGLRPGSILLVPHEFIALFRFVRLLAERDFFPPADRFDAMFAHMEKLRASLSICKETANIIRMETGDLHREILDFAPMTEEKVGSLHDALPYDLERLPRQLDGMLALVARQEILLKTVRGQVPRGKRGKRLPVPAVLIACLAPFALRSLEEHRGTDIRVLEQKVVKWLSKKTNASLLKARTSRKEPREFNSGYVTDCMRALRGNLSRHPLEPPYEHLVQALRTHAPALVGLREVLPNGP